ncbi:hypothetical protein EDB83DRAFT_2318450 [Lactarius deliciosus]|nr:hypothetical protein EDB83DRAFT_2318450 [Lactarius deliciosus]
MAADHRRGGSEPPSYYGAWIFYFVRIGVICGTACSQLFVKQGQILLGTYSKSLATDNKPGVLTTTRGPDFAHRRISLVSTTTLNPPADTHYRPTVLQALLATLLSRYRNLRHTLLPRTRATLPDQVLPKLAGSFMAGDFHWGSEGALTWMLQVTREFRQDLAPAVNGIEGYLENSATRDMLGPLFVPPQR